MLLYSVDTYTTMMSVGATDERLHPLSKERWNLPWNTSYTLIWEKQSKDNVLKQGSRMQYNTQDISDTAKTMVHFTIMMPSSPSSSTSSSSSSSPTSSSPPSSIYHHSFKPSVHMVLLLMFWSPTKSSPFNFYKSRFKTWFLTTCTV